MRADGLLELQVKFTRLGLLLYSDKIDAYGFLLEVLNIGL